MASTTKMVPTKAIDVRIATTWTVRLVRFSSRSTGRDASGAGGGALAARGRDLRSVHPRRGPSRRRPAGHHHLATPVAGASAAAAGSPGRRVPRAPPGPPAGPRPDSRHIRLIPRRRRAGRRDQAQRLRGRAAASAVHRAARPRLGPHVVVAAAGRAVGAQGHRGAGRAQRRSGAVPQRRCAFERGQCATADAGAAPAWRRRRRPGARSGRPPGPGAGRRGAARRGTTRAPGRRCRPPARRHAGAREHRASAPVPRGR